MEKKIELTSVGNYFDGEYYYEEFMDEDGNKFFLKYQQVGLFREEAPTDNIENEVDWEIIG